MTHPAEGGRGAPKVRHPARFSREILDVLRPLLAEAPWIHDPFAGTGERLGALCNELGVGFSGTEIEAPFIVDKRIMHGDSTDPWTYPLATTFVTEADGYPWWIFTSPAYPNGMADHFISSGICSACRGRGWIEVTALDLEPWEAREECLKCKGTGRRSVRRKTYRQAAMEVTGDPTYALDDANMGRHSVRSGRKAEERYWAIADAVVACWGGAERAIVNVKDFVTGDRYVDLADRWGALLDAHGWHEERRIQVPCPGMRDGANRERRVTHEDVLVYVQ